MRWKFRKNQKLHTRCPTMHQGNQYFFASSNWKKRRFKTDTILNVANIKYQVWDVSIIVPHLQWIVEKVLLRLYEIEECTYPHWTKWFWPEIFFYFLIQKQKKVTRRLRPSLRGFRMIVLETVKSFSSKNSAVTPISYSFPSSPYGPTSVRVHVHVDSLALR